jgi:DNA-binding HxlR family transcriptional regulator
MPEKKKRKSPLIDSKTKRLVQSVLSQGGMTSSELRARLAEAGLILSSGSFSLELDQLERAQIITCKSKTVEDVDNNTSLTQRWVELC